MCGIGVIFKAKDDNLKNLTGNLKDRLSHRGPDDSGDLSFLTLPGIELSLIHTRLAIIDTSQKAAQPMKDEHGNIIVFNGEIYNFQEIRSELEKMGEKFYTSSDTEVLLRAYIRFDLNILLCKLRGIFSFAIWDDDLQRLVVARDPMGIKPLYYSKKGYFSCASEASVLVKSGVVSGEISHEGLDSFLAFGSVIEPLTIWKDVKALLPGHFLIVKSNGEMLEPQLYWDWDTSPIDGNTKQLFAQAIDRNLVSDVPVSVFLSGGYDSTAIAAMSVARSKEKLHSFTISFPDNDSYSEGNRAAAIANRLETIHHDVPITFQDVIQKMPDFFSSMDQPSDDGLNTYLVSDAVSKLNFKVAFHGVGGDELFGGYPSFQDLPKFRWIFKLPKFVRDLCAILIDGNSVVRGKLAEVFRGDGSLMENFLIRRRLFSYKQRRELLNKVPPMGIHGVSKYWLANAKRQINSHNDIFESISKLELALYSANKLLKDGDIMSMAHGLEVRFPLLDVDLVSRVQKISAKKKQSKGGGAKPVLVNLVPNFPHDLMSRDKRGFTLPLDYWLRNELKDECKSVLASLPEKLGLQSEAINTIWHQFEKSSGGQEWVRVWQLYTLGKWCEQNEV